MFSDLICEEFFKVGGPKWPIFFLMSIVFGVQFIVTETKSFARLARTSQLVTSNK